VHTQCEYMLLRDDLISGASRVLVRSGDILYSGMVQHIESNVRKISTFDTKNCAQQVLV
jgi:hypothetical protein